MIWTLLAVYGCVQLGCILSTMILIFMGKDWGNLPWYYLDIVRWIQDCFPAVYPKSTSQWPAIIEKEDTYRLLLNSDGQYRYGHQSQYSSTEFEASVNMIRSGVEAIIQDDLSSAFDHGPHYSESLLRTKVQPHWNRIQKALFYATLIFRILFLFPIRIALFTSSFIFAACACLVAIPVKLTSAQKVNISLIYVRLFCSGLGVVARYRNQHLRPVKKGVAISNHLSPNDIQILYANTPYGAEQSYIVTGQKHSGVIGVIEMLVERINPAIWVERKHSSERSNFLSQVLDIAKSSKSGPILLFPEGFCTNNSQILRFRKSVFEDGIDIYPIAIKQDARYGDAYWFDDRFYVYLLKTMCSWAIVYDVEYLPPLRRSADEDNVSFAARAQLVLSRAIDVPQGQFDGSLWYKKAEQEKLRNLQQSTCSASLTRHTALQADIREVETPIEEPNECFIDRPNGLITVSV